ncbi:MAG TPA: PQQ-binding-like beta-propeller repeat protein [Candidatus Acidoferrales bacterium]|jgi:polyvinyl alcohol dehydrogenase (cytochrome)|nr:PQQ-binding-like beta-propeller repeat protein [Candidatus Acidoferrales bacterium]
MNASRWHVRILSLALLITAGAFLASRAPAQAPPPPAATSPATATPVPADQLANRCSPDVKPGSPSAPAWPDWGANPANWRFQPAAAAGISAADVPHLKLKWAFGIPNVRMVRSQPALFAGRVYVSGNDGSVYSLDAATGCTFWTTSTPKPVRSGMLVGKAGSAEAVFFGEADGTVYALDASTGSFLWSTRADSHPAATITGTPSYYEGRLYIPVSSGEEQSRRRPGYECCTFRGSVVAMDAATGKILWRTYMAPDTPSAHGKTPDGRTIYAPSGMAIWSSPTIDVAKKRIYVGTGDNYSEPGTETSDAVVALDLKSGKLLWSAQFDKDDIYKIECGTPPAAGCSPPTVPEFDLGASPILVSLPSGKRVLLLGQKTGIIYGVDPDARGKLLWFKHAGVGGLLGGVQWGPATDGTNVYVAVSDLAFGRGGPDPTKGGGISAYRVDDGTLLWKTSPPGCGDRRPCSPAQSQAVSAIPGAVFSGSIDGHLRAYATSDGKIIWDFDTAQSFDSVNKVPAKGGSLDVGGPVIAGGMIFVVSGYPGFGAMPGNALLAFSAN